MDSVFDVADRLAKHLRSKPWYQRTSVCDQRCETTGRLVTFIEVWGEFEFGEKPPESPTVFEGIPVRFNRVTPKHECPFGSVRAKTRSKKEQDAKQPVDVV